MRIRNLAGIAAAAAIAALPCHAAQQPGSRVATQAWVQQTLANAGIRVSTAAITTNIVVVGGVATTNIVVESAYTCPEVPDCIGLSFTLAPPSRVYATPQARVRRSLLDLFFQSAFADVAHQTMHITVQSGFWVDRSGNTHAFNLGGGWNIDSDQNLPDMPSSTHVCDIGIDCYCTEKDNMADDVEIPSDYDDLSGDELNSFKNIWNWLDKESWQDTSYNARTGDTTYWLTDINGMRFNVEKIAESDAWQKAVDTAVAEVNAWMKECRVAYVLAHICDKGDVLQHAWIATTCGSYTWMVCQRNPEHTEGTERHQFPGTTYTETEHRCVCGREAEQHGELVGNGDRVATYGISGYESGWVQTMVCPKGCGYSTSVTHVHHFTNCGTCDAGDDCSTVCTGCDGEHVFGEKTDKKCAHCECTMSEGCEATPDEDISKHSGWEPCGEDAEDDNDWMEAKGGHCRCECRKYGHLARTEHDYQLTAGEALYEQCTDEDKETRHYVRLGTCTRCGQHKKQKQAHDFPDEPTSYRYKNDEICKAVYMCQCDGCDYEKMVEGSHAPESSPEVCENVSASICRWKYRCENCNGLIKDDTHGHERDTSNECKCKNGCGYQFEHTWITDACGNESCQHCKAGKNGVVESHTGYTEAGDVHRCACGRDEQPHVFGAWTFTGADPGTLHYSHSCLSCGAIRPKDEPCGHSFGAWTAIGRSGGMVTYAHTCTVCGYTEYDTRPEVGVTCDTNLNHHVAAADTCGCQCGKYSPSGEASTDVNLHKWADTVNLDGVQICMCRCGRYHKQRGASASQAASGKVCGEICAYCREKSGTGLDIGRAEDSLHTPCEVSDGRCGCKCGFLTADGTNIAKFHIQKPGTCRCLGANGSGGKWHFRMTHETCQKICACTTEFGGEHLVAASEKEPVTPKRATAADHTKTDASSCGCECGKYRNENAAAWKGSANLHNPDPNKCGCFCGEATEGEITPFHRKRLEIDCECMCDLHKVISHVWSGGDCMCNCRYHDPQHKMVNSGSCTAVCHGQCGEAHDPAKMASHTPAANDCGCECGNFTGASYPNDRRYHKIGSNCMCGCGTFHLGFSGKQGCPNVCDDCGMDYSRAESGPNIHSFGKRCVCGCGEYTRDHVWSGYQKTQTGSYTCAVCGNSIRAYTYTRHCLRDCNAEEEYEGEEGHDLAAHEGGYAGGDLALDYCDKHDVWYTAGVGCPQCKAEDEVSGGGGNETGGGGDGSSGGSLDDIINPLWPIIGPVPGGL